jgi:hypothetical protein
MDYPTWEVTFSVGNDSNLQWLREDVRCLHSSQAQALIEARYGSETKVWGVSQKN